MALTPGLSGTAGGAEAAGDIALPELLEALLPGLLPFQGQVCVALTRLLVPHDRHDERCARAPPSPAAAGGPGAPIGAGTSSRPCSPT